MKFENPIMHISMFNVENVVTVSDNIDAANDQAETALTDLYSNAEVTKVIQIVF